jgi:hypothetical protein
MKHSKPWLFGKVVLGLMALGPLLLVGCGPGQAQGETSGAQSREKVRPRPEEDASGDSTGLFVSKDGLRYTYYVKGRKHGPFRYYYEKTGRLACFGHYANDTVSGDWYYFGEDDLLSMSEHGVGRNDTMMAMNGDGRSIRPIMRSELRLYWPNGRVRAEGIALYNRDPEIDFWSYGPWSSYDTLGRLQEVRDYIPAQLRY